MSSLTMSLIYSEMPGILSLRIFFSGSLEGGWQIENIVVLPLPSCHSMVLFSVVSVTCSQRWSEIR